MARAVAGLLRPDSEQYGVCEKTSQNVERINSEAHAITSDVGTIAGQRDSLGRLSLELGQAIAYFQQDVEKALPGIFQLRKPKMRFPASLHVQ